MVVESPGAGEAVLVLAMGMGGIESVGEASLAGIACQVVPLLVERAQEPRLRLEEEGVRRVGIWSEIGSLEQGVEAVMAERVRIQVPEPPVLLPSPSKDSESSLLVAVRT